ncbi:MAG: cation diffusion facilitator family transporter [Cellvibrionaceae bacterium]|nr:cation diffusion facilitator family transporter [Cellvibrionaceae bacterium]
MLSDRRIRTSLLAIATDLTLATIKLLLAIYTGSAALRADALHSATDLFVSIILLVGIALKLQQEKSQNPSEKPWGHIIEASLAVFVALIILYVPYDIISNIGQHNTQPIKHLAVGIFGTLAVIFIVLFIARLKLYVARQTDSIALEADAYHSMVDVFTSIAVLVSLLGFMVGIELDNTVAVVIAIMITVTGLELLVSGIKSLIQKTALNQVSLYETIAAFAARVLGKVSFARPLIDFAKKLYTYRLLILVLLAASYLLSGFKSIEHGNSGQRFWLATPENRSLEPGLHYALPWPLGKINTYRQGALYSVQIGTRAEALANGQQRLWTEIKSRQLISETANYYLTADEQLVDISLAIFYSVSEPASVLTTLESHHRLVQQLAQYCFNRFVLSHSLDQLLSGDKNTLKDELRQAMQQELASLFPAISIVDLQFQTFRLPAVVIAAYRDVINAQQEKQQAINNAIAHRLQSLPLSRATYTDSIANAESQSLTKILQAEGNIAQISQLSQVQRKLRDGFEFNVYLNTVNQLLSGKRILIKDANLSNSDLKTWQLISDKGNSKK